MHDAVNIFVTTNQISSFTFSTWVDLSLHSQFTFKWAAVEMLWRKRKKEKKNKQKLSITGIAFTCTNINVNWNVWDGIGYIYLYIPCMRIKGIQIYKLNNVRNETKRDESNLRLIDDNEQNKKIKINYRIAIWLWELKIKYLELECRERNVNVSVSARHVEKKARDGRYERKRIDEAHAIHFHCNLRNFPCIDVLWMRVNNL